MKSNQVIELEENFTRKTYRFNRNTIILLEMLSERFEREAGFRLASGKIIELALNYISHMSLKELLRD